MEIKMNIIAEIKNNEKIKRYKKLEDIINNNEILKNILTDLKNIQKEIVQAREFNLTKKLNDLEIKYDTLYESLFEYPLLNEYLDLQTEINNFLKDFSNIIETEINESLMAK